jgi:hypothetical protein
VPRILYGTLRTNERRDLIQPRGIQIGSVVPPVLYLKPGGTSESESQLKERKRHVKNLNNLFGDRGEGHGVARKPKSDSKWGRGVVEGQTILVEDATLWIFNKWIDQNKLAERSIKNWEQQRKIWTNKGAYEELQIKSKAEMVAKMVSSLPVFVLKNLSTYYSGNMLIFQGVLSEVSYELILISYFILACANFERNVVLSDFIDLNTSMAP